MSDRQFGWYIRLLARAWQNENCRIPNDERQLMTLAGCKNVTAWRRSNVLVTSRFKVSADNKWLYNERLLAEFFKAHAKHADQSQAGLRGGLTAGKGRPKAKLRQPEPEPEPYPQPEPEKAKSKPSASAATLKPDSRHAFVRTTIQTSYQKKFNLTCPWDASEARVLAVLLQSNPSWTQEQMARMVENRFASEGVTGARPRSWLPRLSDYTERNDRFNKGAANGTSKTQQRTEHNKRVYEETLALADADSDGGSDAS